MPEVCAEPHPEHPEVTCEKRQPCYGLHWNLTHQMDWNAPPAPPPPPPPKTRRAQAVGIAHGIPAAPTTGPPNPSLSARPVTFFAKSDGPENSRLAIEAYDPSRRTARGRVLAHLYEHLDAWVDAGDLERPEVGGRAGTRRMRELRDLGLNIETRLAPGSKTRWQHRLLLSSPVPTPDWD